MDHLSACQQTVLLTSLDLCTEHKVPGAIQRAQARSLTSIETVPSNPKDPCTYKHHQDIVRLIILQILIYAWANPPCAHKASCAGREMDDIAAGVVDDAHLEEEAAAPEGVSADSVGEGEPEGHKEHPCLRFVSSSGLGLWG